MLSGKDCATLASLGCSTPEFMKLRLDKQVLRIVARKGDLSQFATTYGERGVNAAVTRLSLLGCLSQRGRITRLGREVADFSCSVPFALMLIEAMERGVAHDVSAVVGVLQTGSLVSPRYLVDHQGQFPVDPTSSALTQLGIFNLCQRFSERDRSEKGIITHNYYSVVRRQSELMRELRANYEWSEISYTSDEEKKAEVLACLLKGLALYVYKYVGDDYYVRPGDPHARYLAFETLMRTPAWIVGLPIDHAAKTATDVPAYYIRGATIVEMDQLRERIPHLFYFKTYDEHYDAVHDAVAHYRAEYMLGHRLETRLSYHAEHPRLNLLKEKFELEQQVKPLLNKVSAVVFAHEEEETVSPQVERLEELLAQEFSYMSPAELTSWIADAIVALSEFREQARRTREAAVARTVPQFRVYRPINRPPAPAKKAIEPEPIRLKAEFRLSLKEARQIQGAIQACRPGKPYRYVHLKDRLAGLIEDMQEYGYIIREQDTGLWLLNEKSFELTWFRIVTGPNTIAKFGRVAPYDQQVACVVVPAFHEETWRQRFAAYLSQYEQEWKDGAEARQQRNAELLAAKVAEKAALDLRTQVPTTQHQKAELRRRTKEAGPYPLTDELRLTLEEADQVIAVIRQGRRLKYVLSPRLLAHLHEIKYCEGKFLLEETKFMHANFRILSPDELFCVRLKANDPVSQVTNRHWFERLESAIKNARAGREQPRQATYQVGWEFKLTVQEAKAFLDLSTMSPFLVREIKDTLGSAVYAQLHQHGYLDVNRPHGWIWTYKFNRTKFSVVEEVLCGDRVTVISPGAHQGTNNWWWINDIRRQLENRRG